MGCNSADRLVVRASSGVLLSAPVGVGTVTIGCRKKLPTDHENLVTQNLMCPWF
jgi:hypothetical protein